jgi:hypothetical protein
LNTSFGKRLKHHNSFFCAKIDDHGVRWGDTGQILAQWRCTVASSVALDLPDWAMRSALYRLIRMVIEMAREAGPFFLSSISCLA